MKPNLRKLIFPDLTKAYLIRLCLVSAAAFCLFRYLLLPIHIHGSSMEPAYQDNSFNFCFKLRFFFSPPKRFDVVGIRLAGESVILLKRVVALAGETLEIQNGKLYVGGKRIYEPHLKFPSDWDLPPRMVKPDHVYVIGDNRSVPIKSHVFGQTQLSRIVGGPLW